MDKPQYIEIILANKFRYRRDIKLPIDLVILRMEEISI